MVDYGEKGGVKRERDPVLLSNGFLGRQLFWRVIFVFGLVFRFLGESCGLERSVSYRRLSWTLVSLLLLILLENGNGPLYSNRLVDGTLVLGLSIHGEGAVQVAPSCSWLAPVRGVGDLGESWVPLRRG